MTSRHDAILKSLQNFYGKSSRPVLCITKDFKLFYSNDKMKFFEELCGKTTIKDYISEQSAEDFKKLSGADCLEMEPSEKSPFGRLFAEPIFDGKEIICYKISFGASGEMGPSASTAVGHVNLSKVISDNFMKQLTELSETLMSVKQNASMKIFDELNSMSGIVNGLTETSDNLRKTYSRISRLSSGNKSFFRLSEVVSYLASVTDNVYLAQEFQEDDDKTIIYAAKGGVAEALLKSCRYLKITAGPKSKISVEILYKAGKTVLQLSSNIGNKPVYEPFSSFFTEQGMYNYGLRDTRDFIEKQEGNLLVVKKGTVLSVLISFPTVDINTLPLGIFDAMEGSGFEDLTDEIFEYRELFSEGKKRAPESPIEININNKK